MTKANSERRPNNVESIAAISPLQQGMLFHSLRTQRSDPYYYQLAFSIAGPLDVELLTKAWQHAVDRHQPLRADYRWEETEIPVQVIYRRRAVEPVWLDWCELPEQVRTERLLELLTQLRQRGYDFRRASDLQLHLIRCEPLRHWLVWGYHHVALDGWSASLVLAEVFDTYRRLARGVPPRTERVVPYTAFLEWMKRRNPAEAEAYFGDLLSGFRSATPLPGAGERAPRTAAQGGLAYGEHTVRLTSAQFQLLQARAKTTGVTANTLVQGAWALLLARYADQRDVVFGATVSGRPVELAGIETTAGLFINTLPVRVGIDERMSTRAWLQALQRQNAETRRFEHATLGEVRRAGAWSGEQALFETAVVFENYPVERVLSEARGEGLAVERVALARLTGTHTGRNNYPLSLVAVPDSVLSLTLAYQRAWFEKDAIEELAGQLTHLLMSLADHPEQQLGQLGLRTTEAAAAEFVRDAPEQAAPRLVLQRFAALAAESPGSLALQDGQSRCDRARLVALSDELARALIARGVQPEDRVVLYATRSNEFVIALLGIMKAGAAYVPVDAREPVERLQEIAAESAARLVVCAGTPVPAGVSGDPACVAIEALLGECRGARALPELHGAQAAYVIFTSGSTGRPKGVIVSHEALARYLSGLFSRLGLRAGASMAMASTIAADLGHTVLFGALYSGAPLHLIPEYCVFDPDAFARYMAEHEVAALKIVPSHLRALLHAERAKDVLPSELLVLGGEASDWALVGAIRALRPGCRIFNHFGPTETTVGVSRCELEDAAAQGANVPIGTALPHAELYVLDSEMRRVPPGVAGELYVGGGQLARGYLGRARLSAERFVPNPYGSAGGRLYRTGDRVRGADSGLLEFLGRVDRQVKIRGYRVELAEVEARLCEDPDVAESAVLALESAAGGLQLVGYVVGRRKGVRGEAVRARLAARCPDQLVPSRLLVLDRLPLTANGKLDRGALAEQRAEPHTQRERAANEIERTLVELWQEVLRRPEVGVTDNFFELGGDSILSLQIISRARKRGLKLTPKQVFERQTIRALSELLSSDGRAVQAPSAAAPARDSEPLVPVTQRHLDVLGMAPHELAELYPLSPLQQGMMFHSLYRPGSGVYVSQVSVLIHGLDPQRFARAWRAAVERHEALRAGFVERAELGAALQVIWRQVPDAFSELDWRSRQVGAEMLDELAASERTRDFDLGRPPLQRVLLVHLGDGLHRLIWTHHHIVLDGWSRARLLEEVLRLYAGEPLPRPEAGYKDYFRWLARQDQAASETFWRRQLRELDEPTMLAAALAPADRGSGYAELSRVFSEEQTRRLSEFAARERVTLNTLIQAAWAILLHRYAGQRTVSFGVTVAGRPAELAGAEELLGLFINTLPVIQRPSPSRSLGDFLRALQATNLGLREHEHTPLFEIQRWAGRSGRALFDTILVFENYPVDRALRAPGGELRFEQPDAVGPTHYALTLVVHAGAKISLNYGYRREQFADHQVEALARHLAQLLAAFPDAPGRALGELGLLTEAERAARASWNATRVPPSWPRSPVLAIEAQVRRTPDAIAVVDGGRSLSYAALNARANRLASRLRGRGVGPDVLVGVFAERSLELVVGLLGIMKAGGAYVPLDPELPDARLKAMIGDARLALILTLDPLAPRLCELGVELLRLDRDPPRTLDGADADLPSLTHEQHLAYAIYTSGSTGRPKLVGNTHGALANRLQWMQAAYRLTREDRVLQKTPYGFDVSVWEFFWPLLTGARLVMAPPGVHRDPAQLEALIARHGVTTLHFVPSMLQAFMAASERRLAPTLRQIVSSGEALSPELVREVYARSHADLHNLYGPTEAAIDVTHWSCPRAGVDSKVPIGAPIWNIELHLLDAALQPVPAGVSGELYLGGVGLARGYLHRPQLTAERFVPNPSSAHGERLYRTGDLARYRPDGVLEYLGRSDFQIKIRGQRVELGEIESRLLDSERVREAVVLARERPAGPQLIGYVVAPGLPAPELSRLREALREVLPGHMVPAQLIALERLPLTSNGKLDRSALPDPQGAARPEYAEPNSPLARQLARVWAEVLKLERVGMADNFFELGGHSLLATQVFSRLRSELQVNVPLRVLFETDSLASFERAVAAAQAAGLGAEDVLRLEALVAEVEAG